MLDLYSSKECNYRPISLTCIMCKLMEAIVKDHVMKYLLSKGLLSKEQHAFIANLLACTHDRAISLHNKTPVDVIYIDFSRAFDSVVHSKLLVKLQTFGISGNLLSWICAFLSDRSQCIVIENCSSSWVSVHRAPFLVLYFSFCLSMIFYQCLSMINGMLLYSRPK